MNRERINLTVILFVGIVIFSCGPSPEMILTMTTSAWTPTPKLTLTPSPLPYNLEVELFGESGEIVNYNAFVVAADQEILVDETGKAALVNLPGPEVELFVSAFGYDPILKVMNLERGKNELALTLIKNPLQITPRLFLWDYLYNRK